MECYKLGISCELKEMDGRGNGLQWLRPSRVHLEPGLKDEVEDSPLTEQTDDLSNDVEGKSQMN